MGWEMFGISAISIDIAVGACASMALLSAGVAVAAPAPDPDVIGKKYSVARGLLGDVGVTTVVATVFGDKLPQEECRVVSTSKPPGSSKGNLVQVNLSCYLSASATDPGFSAGNNMPDAHGVRDATQQDSLEWKQTAGGQKWCQSAEIEHPEWVPISGCQEWEQSADGQAWCKTAQIEHPEWCGHVVRLTNKVPG